MVEQARMQGRDAVRLIGGEEKLPEAGVDSAIFPGATPASDAGAVFPRVFQIWNVIGNSERNVRFAWFAQRLEYKWLNRRSQRRCYNMTGFMEAWERWRIPMPSVVEKPWQQTRHAPPHTI